MTLTLQQIYKTVFITGATIYKDLQYRTILVNKTKPT